MIAPERLAKVAEVLAGHREDSTYPDSCLCEDAIPDRDSEGHFAAHAAQALAPLLDEFRAEDEARGARRAAEAVEGVIRERGQQHVAGHVWTRDDRLRAALATVERGEQP